MLSLYFPKILKSITISTYSITKYSNTLTKPFDMAKVLEPTTRENQGLVSLYERFENNIDIEHSFINRRYDHDEILDKAFKVLNRQELIAVPTDTVYGITTLAQSFSAVEKLYSVKKRDPAKPVAICVGDIIDIPKWCNVVVEKQLLNELLPGPVTLVFQRSPNLNPLLNPDTNLVGIRIPQCQFIRELAKRCCQPLALTSANLSLQSSTLTVKEFEHLWPKLGLVIDGGPLGNVDPKRLGSTVVDLSIPSEFHIIRPGCAEKATKTLLEKYGIKEKI